jgi:hypothetical protein
VTRRLKVYGWQGWRPAETGLGSRGATREIVAARSMTEVGRIVGDRPDRLFNLGETGNAEEIRIATAKPGVVFWKSDVAFDAEWHEAAPKDSPR